MPNEIKLRLPLKQIHVTQPFGVNYLEFYHELGMIGHNGIDFAASNGTECYAAHDGEVVWAGKDTDGGISVTLMDKVNHFKTIYYHLQDVTCKVGETKKAGELIGHCDNTGKKTTGSHLHFGLKELDNQNFDVLNYENGYLGAINPAPYFCQTFNGIEISKKDWDKTRCYHRYYRGRPKGGYINELRVVGELIAKWHRLPSNEEINACVYGAWDRGTVENPAMYTIWSQITKNEYKNGEKIVNSSSG